MRKNVFKSLLTMCALAGVFASCSNENNEVPDVNQNEVKPVFMKLNLGQQADLTSKAESRATEDKINNGAVAVVSNLHIYFYKDADKSIQKYLKVDGTTTPSITDLTNGKEIADVPAAADKIFVRGNVPVSVALPTGGSLNTVLTKEIEITTQNDNNQIILGHLPENADAAIQTWAGVGSAPIAGMPNGAKYASITIEPGVARIEVEGLKAGGQVSSFKLKGIYVNNFYKKLTLGSGASTDKENYQADPSKYTMGQGLYTAANTKLSDEFNPALSSSTPGKDVTPTGGSDKRWAYHAFSNDATVANDQLQLIFKVSDLQATSTAITFPAGDQFITVRGFKDSGTGNIVKLEKGKIYTVSKADFEFNESNLSTIPNTNAVGVWLKVTVKPWTVVAVKPNL